eukprot:7571140-Karenia_brevis.AAC.1
MTITLLVSRVMMIMNVSKVMMKKIGLRSLRTVKNFRRSTKKIGLCWQAYKFSKSCQQSFSVAMYVKHDNKIYS